MPAPKGNQNVDVVRYLLKEEQKRSFAFEKQIIALRRACNEITDRYVSPDFLRMAKREYEKANNPNEYVADIFGEREV